MTESQEQPNGSESIEKEGKYLYIDDMPRIVKSINQMLGAHDDFLAVECHSVEEALNAIKANSPKVIFLDHNLTSFGAEGLEIADKVLKMNPEIKIYSTTTDTGVLGAYKAKGIKIAHVEKGDTDAMEVIISQK
jgi:DNA-binding NtrC family response regulator